MDCPNCGKPCEAEYVDNGVGNERITPFSCEPCKWVEPDTYAEYMIDLLNMQL